MTTPISQYLSTNRGVKRGLFVGINKHTAAPLFSCVNDAICMQKAAHEILGFKIEDCKCLLDETATREAFIKSLEEMIALSGPRDVIWVHLSTHGSQVPDMTRDEVDGVDECIVFYTRPDQVWYRDCILTDDELSRFLKKAPKGMRFVWTMDCCHTGTGLRSIGDNIVRANVRYLAPPPEVVRLIIESAHKVAERELTNTEASLPYRSAMRDNITRAWLPDFVKRLFGRKYQENQQNTPGKTKNFLTVEMPGDAVLFAGCKDNQISAETVRNGIGLGAMTASFLDSLYSQRNALLTYQELYDGLILSMMRHGDYRRQHPQLEIDPSVLRMPIFS